MFSFENDKPATWRATSKEVTITYPDGSADVLYLPLKSQWRHGSKQQRLGNDAYQGMNRSILSRRFAKGTASPDQGGRPRLSALTGASGL
jgi:hypothetical protein